MSERRVLTWASGSTSWMIASTRRTGRRGCSASGSSWTQGGMQEACMLHVGGKKGQTSAVPEHNYKTFMAIQWPCSCHY
eukprot:1403949-Prorocentrum_lima.AAC.1